MTTQTRIQLRLQRDTGSIFYQDKDDDLVFHIEAPRPTPPPSPLSPDKTTPAGQAPQAPTGAGGHQAARTAPPELEGHEEEEEEEEEEEGDSAATTDLVKSFLRQHLVRNGERSRCLIPLMKKDGIEALLIATVMLHLRRDGGGDGGGVLRDDGAAIKSLHKTLGSLVSVLQQRERVLRYLGDNPHVVRGNEAEAEAEAEAEGEEE